MGTRATLYFPGVSAAPFSAASSDDFSGLVAEVRIRGLNLGSMDVEGYIRFVYILYIHINEPLW